MWWTKKKTTQIKQTYIYDPMPDITAYEVAKIVPYLIPSMYSPPSKLIEQLPMECLRHIKIGGERLNEIAQKLQNKTSDDKPDA